MTLLEAVAVALGFANIVLLVRRSIWNFPFAIAMVLLYALIFFRARLYSEAGLQVFFAAVNVYGWALWARAGGQGELVDVSWLGWRERIATLAAVAAGTLVIGAAMHRYTDAVMPYPDAFVTSASVAAQLLLSWRRIDNWVLWIVVDCVAIVLYLLRDLALTSGLYAAFLVLSAIGLRTWMRVGVEARGR